MKKGEKPELDLLRNIVQYMKANGLSLSDLIGIYSSSAADIVPVSIFAQGLNPSEALSKYLRENAKLSFHEVGVLLNRDERSVWTSYSRAKERMGERFVVSSTDIWMPVDIFRDRDASILSHCILFLKKRYSMPNREIAKVLNISQGTVATIISREAKR